MTDRSDDKDVDISTRLRQLTDQLRSARTELVRSLRREPMPPAPQRERPLPDKDPSRDA
jgi:hypothetical protein